MMLLGDFCFLELDILWMDIIHKIGMDHDGPLVTLAESSTVSGLVCGQ